MKKFYLIVTVLLTATIFAQSPQKMSYQAVIRNASNNLVVSSSVGIKISILQGSSFGTVVYSETQTTTTNLNGLVSIEIGTGTVVSGTFATINWANGPYFIKTETDPSGGTSYSIVGTSEFLSVPYALYSLNGTPGPQGIQGVPGILPNGTTAGNTTFWNGTSWVTNNSNIFNNGDNVGIGTNNPLLKLHINGDVNNGVGALLSNTSNSNNAFSVLSLTNNTTNGTHLFLNSSTRNTDGGINTATLRNDAGNLRLQAAGAIGLTILSSSGRVGVNNLTPTETLDIVGKTKTTNLQVTTGAGTGKILTSDASGNATWENNTIPTSTVAGLLLTSNASGIPTWQSNTLPTATLAGQILTSNTSGNATWENNSMPAGTANGQMLYWNGTAWLTVPPGTQDQTLTFCSGKPSWGPCPLVLTIGQNYLGGNIAYLDASGQHGLIVGPLSNTFSAPWGCEVITGASSTNGALNTDAIVAACSGNSAARVCSDLVSGGYSDWYLPSLQELALIYPNKAALGFVNDVYWTSKESTINTQAWYIQFANGLQGTTTKGGSFKFRPIRSF